MVQINMTVPHGLYECPGYQITHISKHMRQKSIGRNIERHAQAHVTGSLIQLAGEYSFGWLQRIAIRLFGKFSAGLPLRPFLPWIRDVKLTKHVTWWQRHFPKICRIPGRKYDPTVVRIVFQLVYHLHQLIHPLAVIVCF